MFAISGSSALLDDLEQFVMHLDQHRYALVSLRQTLFSALSALDLSQFRDPRRYFRPFHPFVDARKRNTAQTPLFSYHYADPRQVAVQPSRVSCFLEP
jgi:hypothetical protein